jgi:NAD(P)-dependent dehydrogenase (short-subunit alcohol dehydrogenase family)
LRVNSVMPGMIWTDMWKGGAEWLIAHGVAPPGLTPQELFAKTVEQAVPMKRPQTLADLGEMVAFLLSDRAKNVTGQTIAVDGGVLMT